jgi:hypothetical protein
MAEWIRTVAESFPVKEGPGGTGQAAGGAVRPLRAALRPETAADLVPILAAVFLDVVKEGV